MTGRHLQSTGLMTVAAILVSSALNYAYTLLLGRVLDAEGYGAYASFTSLFMIAAALPVAFQQAQTRRSDGRLSRMGVTWGALAGALLLLGAVSLGPLLGVPAAWMVGFAVILPALVLLGAWRGAAQRDGRVSAFSGSLVAEHGLKIVLTIPLLQVMDGPAAAVAATLAGVLLALPLVRPAAPDTGPRIRTDAAVPPLALAAASQSALLYGDVLLGGMLLTAGDAGAYAAAATLARVVFFAGWAVQVAVFPLVARGDGAPGRLLGTALGGTLLLAGTPALLFTLWPQTCAALAFGATVGAQVAALLPACALGTLLLTLGGTVVNHLLAGGNAATVGRSAALYAGSAAVLTGLAVALGTTPSALAVAALVGKGLLLPAAFLVLLSTVTRRPLYVLR
ncbi:MULTISPECIES: hypothetical protein [Deinococcus]|uniref:Polysaccharide biosynthesis protein n=1 Tax=Deinococcus rufus TaxID=2136097 RepID=A0ABV7Z4T0_9DEIO|nr:hypothetical protein [Deinococcus sp. AB2017081]WQE95528.1 hypothetical protein U2P90_01205 [Deinococcus sp. AB2017081]